jgi:hypothetical protein
MRIAFLNVSGQCEFTDGTLPSEPYVGMTWTGIGPAVLVTGVGGGATVEVDGKRIDVPPRSCIRFGSSGPSSLRRSVEVAIGKAWALIHDDSDWESGVGSGGGGVRG